MKHGIEHDVDSAYRFCIHYDIPEPSSRFHKYLAIQADDDLESLLVCSKIFYLFMEQASFLRALMTPEYSEVL